MTDIEPATGVEIARQLHSGRPLIERMTNTHSALLEGKPEVQALYTDIFVSLVAEAETVPGYGTAMAMMLERFAFVWATMKASDSMDAPLNARDYEKLLTRFRQLYDGLLKARDDRQADAQFKHAFITAFLRVFAQVCDEEMEADASLAFQSKMVSRLKAVEVQGTDEQRRQRP